MKMGQSNDTHLCTPGRILLRTRCLSLAHSPCRPTMSYPTLAGMGRSKLKLASFSIVMGWLPEFIILVLRTTASCRAKML